MTSRLLSSECDTISSDVKQCDNEHLKTTFTQEEPGELQDVKGETGSKLKEGDGHHSASQLGTSVSNDISSDGTRFIPVESVESSPCGKQAPMTKEERKPKNEASTPGGETFVPVKPENSSPSGSPTAMHKEEGIPNTTMSEVSTSSGDRSIYMEAVEFSFSGKEAPVQQEESTPITTMPAASDSRADKSICVEPVDSPLSDKEAPVQ